MTTNEQLDRVQKCQNFTIKVAYGGIRKYDHVSPIFKELQWLNIENKLVYDIGIFTYKVCNDLLPEWLFTFPTTGDIISRATRQSNELYVKRTKTDIGGRAISIKGPRQWNNIPSGVKDSPNLYVFKERLKQHLLQL